MFKLKSLLKGQSYEDLVLLENPVKVLVLIENLQKVTWSC